MCDDVSVLLFSSNESCVSAPPSLPPPTQTGHGGQEPCVRQQGPPALQQPGHVRLPGRGLHGLLLPVPRVRLAQVRRRVPLRQEVALRAGGGGGRRDHPEQVCHLGGGASLLFIYCDLLPVVEDCQYSAECKYMFHFPFFFFCWVFYILYYFGFSCGKVRRDVLWSAGRSTYPIISG